MLSLQAQIPKAEVYTTEALDRIVLVPLRGFDRQDIRKAIKDAVGDVPIKSLAEGISMPARLSPLLLDIDNVINLKWREESRIFAENRSSTFSHINEIRLRVEKIKLQGSNSATQLLDGLPEIELLDDHQKV